MMVRLSPDERTEFEGKAARAGLNRSDAARAAFKAWQPDGGGNAIRNSASDVEATRELTLERDE
jgi:hypothetical protein